MNDDYETANGKAGHNESQLNQFYGIRTNAITPSASAIASAKL